MIVFTVYVRLGTRCIPDLRLLWRPPKPAPARAEPLIGALQAGLKRRSVCGPGNVCWRRGRM